MTFDSTHINFYRFVINLRRDIAYTSMITTRYFLLKENSIFFVERKFDIVYLVITRNMIRNRQFILT